MGITFTPSSWAPVIIGLIIGIYWLCVLGLVIKTKLTVGRAANFVPPEPLGRILRYIWIPVVVLWIFFPMLLPFITGKPFLLEPVSFPGDATLGWVSVGIAVVAFLITCVCWIKMGSSWRMGIDPNEKTKLITAGPYAYVRNPIYGLSQLLMINALCALPCPAMVVIAAIHLAFMQWEVRREEKYLVKLHGQPSAEYMERVGRFVPRIVRWR